MYPGAHVSTHPDKLADHGLRVGDSSALLSENSPVSSDRSRAALRSGRRLSFSTPYAARPALTARLAGLLRTGSAS